MSTNKHLNIFGSTILTIIICAITAVILLSEPRGTEEVATPAAKEGATPAAEEGATREDSATGEFRAFDPNTADYRTLISSGVPRNIAVNIIKWRKSGKVFHIREDLATCYGMTDSLYFLLEPHIIIGKEYRLKPRTTSDNHYQRRSKHHGESKVELEPFSLDTVTSPYLELLGFSPKQAQLIIRYREIIGGYRTFEKFAECYAVDSTMAERLRPYIIFNSDEHADNEVSISQPALPIEINSADSATLVSIVGIGAKSAQQIIRYRELLGGYYSVDQISELSMVTEDNFQRILPQIWCDSAKIKKININFARLNELKTHPYITSRMLKLIVNKRVLKGGWSTIAEMIEDDIFSNEEAMRIAPYLLFGSTSE